jgi:hypothetical protein
MTKTIRALAAMAPAAVLVVQALGVGPAGAGGQEAAVSQCTPKFVAGVMHLCGPATARLSAFPGYVFRNGRCKRETVAGEPNLTLELGQLVPGSEGNGGRPYLQIGISGPLARPTGGRLIAYYKGKRWAGVGESFSGGARGGSFVVRGVPPSRGRATGSFRC